MTTMIGQTISHYKITAKLGEGGMGEVYLAEDLQLGRQVAIKFLAAVKSSDAESRKRFLHEAQAQAMLNHPNIATFHEVGEADDRAFIVMEYIEGSLLQDAVRSENLSLGEILNLVIQAGEGLQAAHEKEVIHRDIKPENIMVTPKGHVKIMDFGLARWKQASTLTKTGTRMGTAYYMSPEQAEGKRVDHRSDIFSLGVVLYELLSNQRPFEGETEAAILYELTTKTPDPLARYRRDVTASLETIVSKCLAKSPAERYQSCADLVTDLRNEQKVSGTSTPPPVFSTTTSAPPAKRSKLPRMVISASVLSVILVLLLVLKPWRIVVEPTQDAAAGEDRLAVMYFDNLAHPDDPRKLGEITTNLLITDLSQSRYVKVVSSQRLYDVLKALGREGTKTINRDVATQVAERAQAKWMMLGSILQEEPNIVLTAQLVEVASGNVLASQRVDGARGERIFSLVDRLTVGIKKDLALPAAALDEVDPQIIDITSSSTAAYAYYLEGIDYYYRYLWQDAKESFLRALELDSTLALAYYGLSLTATTSTTADLEAAIAKAMQYLDGAGDLDQRYIRARSAALANNVSEATRELEGILTQYPDEKVACFRLARLYENRNFDKTLAMLERAIAIDPLYEDPYNNLAYSYTFNGEFDKALWAINKYIELAPDDPNPYDSRGELYAMEGRLDEAGASFQKALEINPEFLESIFNLAALALYRQDYDSVRSCARGIMAHTIPNVRARGRMLLASIPIHQGRFRDAIGQLKSGIITDRMELGEGPDVVRKLWIIARIFAELGQLDSAISWARQAKEVIAINDPNSVMAILIKWQLVGCHAKNGDEAATDSLIQLLTDDFVRSDSAHGNIYWVARGHVAFARQDYQSAAEYFERSLSVRVFFPLLVGAARNFYALGQLADAVTMFEKAERWHDVVRPSLGIESVKVHYWLAQAYEKSGWNDKAIEQYETFLDIWKDADPGIGEIDDARARLERLREGSS